MANPKGPKSMKSTHPNVTSQQRLRSSATSRSTHLTGKYPQGEWVGEAPGGACGAGSCCAGAGLGSGGGFEGDAVAHRHRLRDVVACSAFGVDPGGVVVGAEVGVAGG